MNDPRLPQYVKVEEVRTDYHDDYDKYTAIDVWFPNNDEGTCAAKVYDNGFVEWCDEHNYGFKNNPFVLSAIGEVLQHVI